jgi:hypothetical protein
MKRAFAFFFTLLTASALQAQAPWAPEDVQQAVRKMLPEGVPFSDTARVYKLP